jgi:BirA family transcriptional regulator, biotin operon repressor / biotin---[acetyl-CoA-carboxylase] ligase
VASLPDRPPLDPASLRAALVAEGSLWRSIEVLDSIGSTNAVLAAAASDGAPEGTVVVAEHQEAGRGRLDRTWVSPPRSGLTVSLLLRPDVPGSRRSWLPLLAGVALAEAVGDVADVRAALKWPNDLLAADGGKLAGVLAETVPGGGSVGGVPVGGVVVGVGLNVSATEGELPEGGTSLLVQGAAHLDRTALLTGFLDGLARRYRRWTAAIGDPIASGLARDYLAWSATVGSPVAVTLPDGQVLRGVAEAVDWDGRLVVMTDGGRVELSAGDVRHVRRG